MTCDMLRYFVATLKVVRVSLDTGNVDLLPSIGASLVSLSEGSLGKAALWLVFQTQAHILMIDQKAQLVMNLWVS